MKVNLTIDRIVLDGLPVGAHEGPLIQAAIAAELTRLFADGADAMADAQGRTAPFVRGEPIQVAPGGVDSLGAQIGQAIFAELGR